MQLHSNNNQIKTTNTTKTLHKTQTHPQQSKQNSINTRQHNNAHATTFKQPSNQNTTTKMQPHFTTRFLNARHKNHINRISITKNRHFFVLFYLGQHKLALCLQRIKILKSDFETFVRQPWSRQRQKRV